MLSVKLKSNWLELVKRLGIHSCHRFLVISCAIFLAGCNKPETVPPTAIESTITCVSPVWDFGTIDPVVTREVEHEFVISNNTSKPVRIAGIETSCGCTSVDSTDKVIAPHSSLGIKTVTKTAGQPGPFQKSATVTLATKPPSSLQLAIQGKLISTPALFSVPQDVDFGTVAGDERRSRTLTLGRFNGRELKIREPRLDWEGLSVEVVNNSATRATLTVHADGALIEPNQVEASLTVYEDGRQEPSLRVPVRIRGRRDMHGLKASLFVRRLAVGEEAMIALTDDSNVAQSIKSVEYSGSSALRVEFVAGAGSNGKLRVVRDDSWAAEGVVKGRLLIALRGTNDVVPVRLAAFLPKTKRGGSPPSQ
ncbi:MAG: DUF1573 domain-containing protein [Fuerstiella sp.]